MTNQTKMALKSLQERFSVNEMPPIHEKITFLNRLEMRLVAGGENQGECGAGNIGFVKSIHQQEVPPVTHQ